MKLLFKKDENSEISVVQKIDNQETDFSYVDMIKTLIKSKVMEPPEISDGFTEEEKNSIKSMVKHINAAITQ